MQQLILRCPHGWKIVLVVISSNDTQLMHAYAALSHCWSEIENAVIEIMLQFYNIDMHPGG